MPSDDRERHFENALAGHLRAGHSAGDVGDSCADAEVLAAYHQGSFPPERIASLKTHVSACSRCQEILSLLEVTDEIPLAAADVAQAAVGPAKSSVHILPSRKPTVWRWVAPAGALAAGLLVWVAIRENNSVRVPPQAPIINSKASGAAKDLLPSPRTETPPAATYDSRALEASPRSSDVLQAAPGSTVPAPGNRRSRMPSKNDELSQAEKKSETDDFAQFLENSPSSTASSALDSKVRRDAPAMPANRGKDTLPSSAAATSTLSQGALAGQAGGTVAGVPAPPPVPQAPPRESEQLSANTAPSPARALVLQRQSDAALTKEKAEMRLANSLSEITISTPDERVSWRIAQGGIIEFSSDAGKTWTVQPSGVVTDLLAGSAPSNQVCWIVGRAGTILRTTDGGAHWQKLRSPTQDDLRSVFAVNARQATISLANADYETKDGGATWNQLPPNK